MEEENYKVYFCVHGQKEEEKIYTVYVNSILELQNKI